MNLINKKKKKKKIYRFLWAVGNSFPRPRVGYMAKLEVPKGRT